MSLREVLTWPDARLSQVCAPIGGITSDIEDLSQDLLDTMYAAPGRGLAAPQVGEMVRMFVMDATWKDGARDPMVFVNPVVLRSSDTRAVNSEGCLSIPGILVDVERPDTVRLRWIDLSGSVQETDFSGFAAICVQHEMDHLDGKVTFDRVDAETRARVLRNYSEAMT